MEQELKAQSKKLEDFDKTNPQVFKEIKQRKKLRSNNSWLMTNCPSCQSDRIRKTGFTPKTRHQRYRCNDCNTTWSDDVHGSEPIGDRPMTDAEKMRQYRRRKKTGSNVLKPLWLSVMGIPVNVESLSKYDLLP